MPCFEFNPNTCSTDTRGTLCTSSQVGYIAASVNANTNCSFQYTVFIDRWNTNLQQWDEVWSEQGVANQNHDYLTTGSTIRTFRSRIYVWANGLMFTGASFTHKG